MPNTVADFVQPLHESQAVPSELGVSPVVAFAKRGIDLLFAPVILAFVVPLFPFIAMAIKLESAGPVFIRQIRVGRCHQTHVEIVPMLKFRTMRTDAERDTGAIWATQDDPRVTRVGRFLRSSRLDELPQLWNVLQGSMSLIGPRPERPSIVARLERELPNYLERTNGVLPGITGLAQVHVGYDGSIDDVRRKIRHDQLYARALKHPRTWLWCDATVVVRTLIVVACRRGR